MEPLFEFAISQHQKKLPSRRFVACWFASCIVHMAFLFALIEYPQLLKHGTGLWYRPPTVIGKAELDPDWRQVAVVASPEAMRRPSIETLRALIYDWGKAGEAAKNPPIQVRWGDEELAKTEEAQPVTRVLGMEEPKPAPEGVAGPPVPDAAGDPAGARAAIPYLPEPGPDVAPKDTPEKVAEAEKRMVSPTEIPKEPAKEPEKAAEPARNETQAQSAPKIFQDRQSAIRTEGSGFFDTRGFPMGEYATTVIEIVKGNWMIPSNLRNSRGRTTIIFFIGTDGHYLDAQIVVPSGSPSLDIAALSAVIGSTFPPLPEGFPGDRVGAKFVFSYNERQ